MNKHKQLVDLLIKKAEDGSLAWKPSIEDGEFTLSFSSRTLIISEISKENARGRNYIYINIAITDDEGRIVDSFDNYTLDTDGFDKIWLEKMTGLFVSARRTALGAEKALNDILAELAD